MAGKKWKNGKLPAKPVWKKEKREARARMTVRDPEAEVAEEVVVEVTRPGPMTAKTDGDRSRETQGAGPKLGPGDSRPRDRKWDQQRQKFQRLCSPRRGRKQELKILTSTTIAVFMWLIRTLTGLELTILRRSMTNILLKLRDSCRWSIRRSVVQLLAILHQTCEVRTGTGEARI